LCSGEARNRCRLSMSVLLEQSFSCQCCDWLSGMVDVYS
jgi:hypothetical protein